jgi:hypothetical protein
VHVREQHRPLAVPELERQRLVRGEHHVRERRIARERLDLEAELTICGGERVPLCARPARIGALQLARLVPHVRVDRVRDAIAVRPAHQDGAAPPSRRRFREGAPCIVGGHLSFLLS